MKILLPMVLVFVLSACEGDPRSPIERARDNAVACLEIGGKATFKKYALGIYVTCEVDEG